MGKRMRSDLPKVLHPLAGKPLLGHVLDTARELERHRLIVVDGHGGDALRKKFADPDIVWVRQEPQLGTGHAVQQAAGFLDEEHPTLVLYGDVPLTAAATLKRLADAAGESSLAVLTVMLDDPTGYGRIVRDTSGRIARIVEEKDADAAERSIREVNSGIMVAPTRSLKNWLSRLSNSNAQGEYYLTDIVAQSVLDGVPVISAQPLSAWETVGVNSMAQLAQLERRYQMLQAERLLEAGVTLADPSRIDVRGTLLCGRDVSIDVGCVFEGNVSLGDRVRVGAHCVLRNVRIADDSIIEPLSHLDDAVIGGNNRIGPFARLRPGTVLADDVHIGNFVEVKNSRIAANSKANHLSYVGDTTIGERVNVGAGTITCNYDGKKKHQTLIGDGAFVGSNSTLVAPIAIGAGSYIGAASVITKSVPEGALAIGRGHQVIKEGWMKRKAEEQAG